MGVASVAKCQNPDQAGAIFFLAAAIVGSSSTRVNQLGTFFLIVALTMPRTMSKKRDEGKTEEEAPAAKAAKTEDEAPAASLPASPRGTAGTHSGQGHTGPFGTQVPAPPVGDLPPDDDQSCDSQALVKKIAASVLTHLPSFMVANKTIFTSHEKAPHLHGALPISSSGGMSSYKAPWDGVFAKDSLANSGLYQASANVIWLNPFPVSNAAQCIAGDVPTWSQVVEAANLFMSNSAAQDKVSLAAHSGTSVQRILFPITVPAHCASPDAGAATGVLAILPLSLGRSTCGHGTWACTGRS